MEGQLVGTGGQAVHSYSVQMLVLACDDMWLGPVVAGSGGGCRNALTRPPVTEWLQEVICAHSVVLEWYMLSTIVGEQVDGNGKGLFFHKD